MNVCKLGWHEWTEWGGVHIPAVSANGSNPRREIYVQLRHCKQCGKGDSRTVDDS